MKISRILGAAMLLSAMVVTSACGFGQTGAAPGAVNVSDRQSKMPAFTKAPTADQYAVFTTNMGTFKVRLYGSKAPITVKNFEYLTQKGFYNDLTFHRVIDGFMIQGGDPNGNGTGGPGYEIPDESNDLHFNKAGMVAMANRGPNTGGSQFFITLGPTNWLENKHTIFGEVVQGMDVVQKIGQVKTGKNDKPQEAVVIQSIALEAIKDDK